MDAAIRRNQRAAGLLRDSPLVLLTFQAVAFWNVWRWMAGRFATSGEAGWELLPLLSVFFLAWLAGREAESRIGSAALILAAGFAVMYALGFVFAPPMVRAFFAMASVTVIVSSWRFGRLFDTAIFALLLLGLPVTESLNFFLGYPMRAAVGEAVEFLLSLQGLDVYREGVGLHFNEQLIWIDAPCSGIKMLWFGTFLAVFLSSFLKLGPVRLIVVLVISLGAILAGNVLRASALFYFESGLIEAPVWMHSAAGVSAFAVTCLAIVLVVKKVSMLKWQK